MGIGDVRMVTGTTNLVFASGWQRRTVVRNAEYQ
jgi:hypothetical protein